MGFSKSQSRGKERLKKVDLKDEMDRESTKWTGARKI